MKVKATRTGYFGGALIEPDTVFTIESEEQLGTWMEPVEDEKPAKAEKAEKAK